MENSFDPNGVEEDNGAADGLPEKEQASKLGFAIGIMFFLLLVADAIAATILLIKHIWIGTIVCAALFGLTIIVILTTVTVRQAISTRGNISKAKKIIVGKVKECFNSGVNAEGVIGEEYKVVVFVDGEEYVVYSNRYYETDAAVTVAVMGKRTAKIVSDEMLLNLTK